jgi:hypothetical protein
MAQPTRDLRVSYVKGATRSVRLATASPQRPLAPGCSNVQLATYRSIRFATSGIPAALPWRAVNHETILQALRGWVDTVLDGEPVTGVVRQVGTDTLYVQRYVIAIVPHASVGPHAIDQVRNREADRVRDAIDRDPTLGGRVPDGRTRYVRAERSATDGEVGVAYLIATR